MTQIRIPYVQNLGTPTNMFPALSGWHGGLQTTTNYRIQTPGVPATSVFYNVGADGYSDKLHSGFSLNLSHDRFSTGIVNVNKADFNWAPKISLKNDLVIMPSLSVSYFQIAIDWNQFSTSPNPVHNWIFDESSSNYITQAVNALSFGTGLGLVYKDAFFVANIHDATQPSLGFYPATTLRLPRTYSVLAGRIFTSGNWHFTPRVAYHRWDEFNNLNLGLNVQYRGFYFGADYNWGDRAGMAFGGEISDRVRLSYSYDITVSRLGTQTLGSHEVGIRVWLYKDRIKKQFLSNLALI